MKIYVGADHNGFRYKQEVIDWLIKHKYSVHDSGDTHIDVNDDFPIFAAKVATAVLSNEDTYGILICGSGQGMVMAANRFKGIRAGLGYSVPAAKSIRIDEDANVISLPSSVFNSSEWQKILVAFLHTEFSAAPRFKRRNQELDNIS